MLKFPAENFNFRFFIYLVDKREIFKQLERDAPPENQREEGVTYVVEDFIVSTLLHNCQKEGLKQFYPHRAVLVYNINKKDDQIQ